MRTAADKGLTTPALMVNGFGHALLMTTQGDHQLARKGSLALAACSPGPGEHSARHNHAQGLRDRWRLTQELNQAGLIGYSLSLLSRIEAARGDREGCEAHVEQARRDVERAGQVLDWLQERADSTGLAYPEAAAARARGILACDMAEAETWFAKAKAAHRRRPMPFEQARTLLSEGEALRRARRPAAARWRLRHALILFSGLGARPWLTRTMTELAATGSGLTPATAQVRLLWTR